MLGEWTVHGSHAMEFTRVVVDRVPGGYMDRWSIRRVRHLPDRTRVVMVPGARQVYCHPALVDEIRTFVRVLEARNGFPSWMRRSA